MFRKIQIRLSFLCCIITALLVLAIVLCCLKISEKNMYGQEEVLFFLRANAVSYELHAAETVSINWYMRNVRHGENMLYLEVDGVPSILSEVVLTESERMFVEKVETYITENGIVPIEGLFSSEMKYFEYGKEQPGFLGMYGIISEKEPCVTYLYLYSLKSFRENVKMQRMRFLFVWLLSIPVVYVFSYGFTSHVLKPVAQNHEKQKTFIAFASHELRSPLAVLKTGLSILKNKPDTEKRSRIFSLMDNEMSRMERLIQDLLCLVKAEQAGLGIQFAPADLSDLAEEVYEKYDGIAKEKGILLSYVKKEGCDYHCICDSQRMEQVMIILLDNALSYTPSGQEASLRLYRRHARFYIQVVDTGKGISDEEKEKIFDKFYRASSSRSDKEHFGLGLSIAKEICGSHGGKISVSDTRGGGSTFTVKLPVRGRT